MKTKRARFDILVTRYYLWEAVLLTHDAFNSTRKQLRRRRGEVALVTILLNAVIREYFFETVRVVS